MTDREYLPLIDDQVTSLLASRWVDLDEACTNSKLRYPGVYVLAYSERALASKQVRVKDIFYVGMSVARHGVQQRLKQFRAGIECNGRYSGAMRFYREHAGGKPFAKLKTNSRFYAAAHVTECERQSSSDWRDMGHVACLECYAIAYVLEKTGHVPRLNLAKTPTSHTVAE